MSARRRALVAALLLAPLTAMAQNLDQALLQAAATGNLVETRRLLAADASAHGHNERGRTALLLATIGDHVEVARALIEAGADVNAQDRQLDSPFLYAGAEGRNEILKLTLAHGADLTSTNRYGGTALIPAAHHGHVETVRILLGTKIDRNHINRMGWTALLEAVILGDGGPTHTEIVRLLLTHGADPSIADREGVGPLGHARARGFEAMVALIEAAGGR